MATDFEITLEHRPGELGKLGKALGDAAINILGFCATTSGETGTVHLLVEDDGETRRALDSLGAAYREREMVVVEVEDAPGKLGEVAEQVAARGGNIELAYTIVGGVRLAIAADDLSAVEPRS